MKSAENSLSTDKINSYSLVAWLLFSGCSRVLIGILIRPFRGGGPVTGAERRSGTARFNERNNKKSGAQNNENVTNVHEAFSGVVTDLL